MKIPPLLFEENVDIEGGDTANNIKGELIMSKFAKKTKTEEVVTKKVKLWTNNPEWQDQDTGVNTAAGDAQIKAVASGKKTKEAVEKEGKAKKAAKPALKVVKGEKAERVVKEDTRKITVLSKENPYREGTKAAATFDLIKKSKTVAAFKAGLTDAHSAGYLNYAERDGFISVA